VTYHDPVNRQRHGGREGGGQFLNGVADTGIMKITDVRAIQLYWTEELPLPTGPCACRVGAETDMGDVGITSVMVSSSEFHPRFVRSVSVTRPVSQWAEGAQAGLAVARFSRAEEAY
jgi:hypothetical protein